VIEIRNLQFQPLTFNLADDRSLHLGPRERTSIPQKDISSEITLAEPPSGVISVKLSCP
jgi:hypothetical protein